MRAVTYARFSTDLQSAASIDDQVRVCRERVVREDDLRAATFGDDATRDGCREVLGPCLKTFRVRLRREVGRGLDPEDGSPAPAQWSEQDAVVAADLDHE